LEFPAAAAGCAAGVVDGFVVVLFVSSVSGAVVKNALILGLLSLLVSFFRGIVCSGTIEGKAQKILVSLRKKKSNSTFFFKKKIFF
jgi:hypothetical protein